MAELNHEAAIEDRAIPVPESIPSGREKHSIIDDCVEVLARPSQTSANNFGDLLDIIQICEPGDEQAGA